MGVPDFADPVLTASLYCAGRLDEVIREVVGPFRQELRRLAAGSTGYLWMVRYSRGGEHLKIRLHGTESHAAVARDLLGALAEHCFAGLGGGGQEAGAPTVRASPPPVDHEDETESGYADRTLLWTHYRRSPVSLAGEPLLLDDTYTALATRCLGCGCDLALAALAEDPSPSGRQLSLLLALIGGLAAAGFPAAVRAAYCAFHRDCLVRAWLVRRGAAAARAAQLTAQFDLRRNAMAALLAPVQEWAEAEWRSPAGQAGAGQADDAAWRSSLLDLCRYVSQFREDPEYRLDPFAEDALFPVLFKVFHGFANQLGVNSLEEAFLHHALLAMGQPPGTASLPVRLFDGDAGAAASEDGRANAEPLRAAGPGVHQWAHFVARSGPEGAQWMSEYRKAGRADLIQSADCALEQLRRQRLPEGKALLDQVAGQLELLDGVPASLRLVIQRFFWATLAYYHYCIGELERAEQALDQAHQAIVSAIESAPFLLPLAIHSHEFRLQHARVARRRRRWRDMKERLQEVRAMLEDRLPLCTLSDGRTIYLSTVADFHRALPALDAEELASLRFFLDEEHRRQSIDSFLMSLYVLPGVVIQYP